MAPLPVRQPLEDILRALRDSLTDEGRMDQAAVVDCLVDVVERVPWHRRAGSERTPYELVADAITVLDFTGWSDAPSQADRHN